MKSHLISISDIARNLGISASTVSRALKDSPSISARTKGRVMEMAQQSGYRPNILAMSLRKQSSKTIGLIIPEIAHHFFSSVISGIEELAYASGYRVMICQSNEDQSREELNLTALLDHRVDGVLVSVSKNTLGFDHFRKVLEQGVPLVFFDRISQELATDRVVTNDYEGARAITSHLIEKGRRNIVHLAAPRYLLVGRERLRGYDQALYENNIERQSDFVLQCDNREQVLALQDEILKLAPRIDAIFAVNDFTAIAAMQLLQANGYKVPADIAIAGFGDDPIASIVTPKLTTVEQKGYEMGKESVQLLIQRIENPDKEFQPRTRVFESTVKVRESG
jgi:DNA-binding LacI/PurR family transcriptional regulator